MNHRGSVVFTVGLAVAVVGSVPAFPQPNSDIVDCDCTCVAGSVSEQQRWSVPPGRSCIILNSTATNKTSCQVRGHEGTLQRCVPHVNKWPPPYDGPLSNWDLVSAVSDDNGLLKNPVWLFQTKASVGPPKDLAGCLKTHRFDSSCTSQKVTLDTASGTNEVPCGSDLRGIHPGSPVGVDGHVNWLNATYEGSLSWDENSIDHDFNFNLDPPPGMLFPIGSFYFFDGVQWNFEYGDKPVHVEFVSDETIDHFLDPWWKSLHDNHPGKDAALGFAVVTGLIGLDCEHDCHIEIHPVYAMAIRVKDDPSDETWAIFLRDSGTEGFCSSDRHAWQRGDSIKFRLPWNPAANDPLARVTVKSSSFWENDHPIAGPVVTPFRPQPGTALTRREGSLLVSFQALPAPPSDPNWVFNGELHLQYSGRINKSRAQPPTPRPPATLTPARIPVADAEERVDKLIAQMSPAQRQVYLERLKATVANPPIPPRSGAASIPGTQLPSVGLGPDPRKLATDLALRDALCAAFSNNVPEFPGWCEVSGPMRPAQPNAPRSPPR